MQTYSLTIDGKATPTARTSDILNPADGTLVAACPEGDIARLGSVKCSGIGVEFNVDDLKEYTTIQVVNVAR